MNLCLTADIAKPATLHALAAGKISPRAWVDRVGGRLAGFGWGLTLGLMLASAPASASLIVLDPGAQPLQDTSLAVARGWVARPLGLDKLGAWSLFPVNDQSCCVLGSEVVASAVWLAGTAPTTNSPSATGSVLTLESPARRAVPKVAADTFGGPMSPGLDPGPAQGEKNLHSLVAAGLARGGHWSLALALRDTVLPEFDLGHCGNNQALCSTWVDRHEVVAYRRGGTVGSRALAADRFLGASVSLPEDGAESASDRR